MKRFISALAIILFLTSAFAESINTIIPDLSLWGISRKDFIKEQEYDFQAMEIGKKKVLQRSGIEIDDILMDAYYVFDYYTWDSTGYTYNGLSKIVYLLTDYKEHDLPTLRDIRQHFIDSMTTYVGEPNTKAKAVSTWNMAGYKIEIGIGDFKKYTGSKHKNVAVVFSGIEIPKPVTPPPTPVPTPKYTYNSPTPKPKLLSDKECTKLAISYLKQEVGNVEILTTIPSTVVGSNWYVIGIQYRDRYSKKGAAVGISRIDGSLISIEY